MRVDRGFAMNEPRVSPKAEIYVLKRRSKLCVLRPDILTRTPGPISHKGVPIVPDDHSIPGTFDSAGRQRWRLISNNPPPRTHAKSVPGMLRVAGELCLRLSPSRDRADPRKSHAARMHSPRSHLHSKSPP